MRLCSLRWCQAEMRGQGTSEAGDTRQFFGGEVTGRRRREGRGDLVAVWLRGKEEQKRVKQRSGPPATLRRRRDRDAGKGEGGAGTGKRKEGRCLFSRRVENEK
ncbi:hypothetical protein KY289_013433 [Solanum tuberosum]|nr:hypothetical protein KY289_013433 [Solanum tuberosum]